MAHDKIDRDSRTFTKSQLRAEILNQELQESDDRLRWQLARLRRQYAQEFEERKARGQNLFLSIETFKGIYEAMCPMLEQRRQIREQKAQLQIIFMREEWRQAKNIPEKAATIRKWAPYWLRPDFKVKMRSSIELWALRSVIKVLKRLH